MASRTYRDALALLAQTHANRTVTAMVSASPDVNARSLPEMRTWLRRAGHSTSDLARLRCVHVAGTKGKGSTSAYIAGILRAWERRKLGRDGAAPERTKKIGLYTSPHLVSVRERIVLDGQAIGPDLYARSFFEVWDAIGESLRKEGGAEERPGFFRLMTILALHVFLREGVGDAVVECGIGGEYDATNVLPPEAVSATVVTQLGVDHQGMLGATREDIAWHKAGIFRRGIPAVTRRLGGNGEAGEKVRGVLLDRAREKGARLIEVKDADVMAWGGVGELAAAGGGGFVARNQALAVVAAMEHLGLAYDAEQPLEKVPEVFLEGLRETCLRGRSEVVRRNGVAWCLDGAHTHESLQAAGRWFGSVAAREGEDEEIGVVLVFNQQERDAPALVRTLVRSIRDAVAARVGFSLAIFTRNELARPAKDSEEETRNTGVQEAAAGTMAEMVPGIETRVTRSVEHAVWLAERCADLRKAEGRRTAVLVAGSFHLVGSVVRVLEGLGAEET